MTAATKRKLKALEAETVEEALGVLGARRSTARETERATTDAIVKIVKAEGYPIARASELTGVTRQTLYSNLEKAS